MVRRSCDELGVAHLDMDRRRPRSPYVHARTARQEHRSGSTRLHLLWRHGRRACDAAGRVGLDHTSHRLGRTAGYPLGVASYRTGRNRPAASLSFEHDYIPPVPAALHRSRIVHLLDAAAPRAPSIPRGGRSPPGCGPLLVSVRRGRTPAAARSAALEERLSPILAVAEPAAGATARRTHRAVSYQRLGELRARMDMGVGHHASPLYPGTPVLSVGVPAIGHSGMDLASGLASKSLLHRLHGNPHSPAAILLRQLQRSLLTGERAFHLPALLVLRGYPLAARINENERAAGGGTSTWHRLHSGDTGHRLPYCVRRVGARDELGPCVPVRAE